MAKSRKSRKPKPRVILRMYRRRLVYDGDGWVRMEVADGRDRMGRALWKGAFVTESAEAQVVDQIGRALIEQRRKAKRSRRG